MSHFPQFEYLSFRSSCNLRISKPWRYLRLLGIAFFPQIRPSTRNLIFCSKNWKCIFRYHFGNSSARNIAISYFRISKPLRHLQQSLLGSACFPQIPPSTRNLKFLVLMKDILCVEIKANFNYRMMETKIFYCAKKQRKT